MAIGRMLRELGEAVDTLPVLPPPEEPGQTRYVGADRLIYGIDQWDKSCSRFEEYG